MSGIRRSIRREPASGESAPPGLTRIYLGNLSPKAREAILATYYRERARLVLPITSEDLSRARDWLLGNPDGGAVGGKGHAPYRVSFERVMTKLVREDPHFRQGIAHRIAALGGGPEFEQTENGRPQAGPRKRRSNKR